jgi:hypothetical protein
VNEIKFYRRLNKETSMRINDYIHVQEILTTEDMNSMIFGAVIEGNIMDKRMDRYIVEPRILILSGSLDDH